MTFAALNALTTQTARPRWGFSWKKTSLLSAAIITGRTTNALSTVRLPGGYLSVRVEAVEDGVVATDPLSGIFGEGLSEEDATRDLVEHLRISIRGLQARESRLGADLREELDRLRALFGL